MRSQRRKTLAFVISLLVHAVPFAGALLAFGPSVQFPELEIEFAEVEMVDPDTLQGAPPVEPEPPLAAPPPPSQPENPPEVQEDGEQEQKQEEQRPDARKIADRAPDVEKLGPTTSKLFVLLVNQRVRKLPFAARGVDLLAPLPDFQFIIQGAGFDVLHDFDYVVIATADPRDVTQTFLAVEYRIGQEEIRAGIERAVAEHHQVIQWEQRGGRLMGNPRPSDPDRPDIDPRWFVFLDDKLAVYVREEFLPSIQAGPRDDRNTSGNFVANLTRMRRFSSQEPRAGLMIQIKDLHLGTRRIRGFPFKLPDEIKATVEASENPELVIVHRFLTAADAEAAERWWRQDFKRLLDDHFALRMYMGWLYDTAELDRDGEILVLRGSFTRAQAETVLDLLTKLSRELLGKTPEEMEADRKAREDAWLRRDKGKLPPSAAYGAPEETSSEVKPTDPPSPADAGNDAMPPPAETPPPVEPQPSPGE